MLFDILRESPNGKFKITNRVFYTNESKKVLNFTIFRYTMIIKKSSQESVVLMGEKS